MSSGAITLGLFLDGGPTVVPLERWLDDEPPKRPGNVSAEWSTIDVRTDAGERWPTLNTGRLATVVGQLPDALRRLTDGTTAIIRSGHLDSSSALLLVIEPHGGRAEVSLGLVTDESAEVDLVPGRPGAEALFRFVAEHRAQVLAAPSDPPAPARIATSVLIDSLVRQQALGEQALAALPPVAWW